MLMAFGSRRLHIIRTDHHLPSDPCQALSPTIRLWGGTSSVPTYVETVQRPLPEFSPPSYSSDEHRLQDSSTGVETEPTVHPPSRSPSPFVHPQYAHPQYAPPAGPPPRHLHHESGIEVDADEREGSHGRSRRSSRAGSPAPALLRSSSNSNSARASVYAPPPGPPMPYGGTSGAVHTPHDGFVRTSSASSSSYVTSLSRPGTPGSPFGPNAMLHPHSPNWSPPRSRSTSPSLLSRSHSSRPVSPLLPVSSRPHSPATFNNNGLPSASGSLSPTPSMPAPSVPNFNSTGTSSSPIGGSPFSPLGASSSGLGHALLWGAPSTNSVHQDEIVRPTLTSPPSMPVPELLSHSVSAPDFSLKDVPPVPPKDVTTGSSSDVGPTSAETPAGNDSVRSATTDDENNARPRFASNNPFRSFVS